VSDWAVTARSGRLRAGPGGAAFGTVFAAAGAAMLGYALWSGSVWWSRLAITVCGTTPAGAHAVLLGFVLLLVGRSMARERRIGWLLALGLTSWNLLTEVFPPGSTWRLGLLALLTVALVHARHRFTVPVDPHRLRQAATVVTSTGAVLILLGGGSLFAERTRFADPMSAGRLGRELVAAVSANPGPVDFSGPGWLLPSVGLLSGIALVAAIAWLSAPSAPPPRADDRQRAAVRALVAHPDSDTLAPFSLRYDKVYAFAPSGAAVLGYRVLAGMAVVGGDPVGRAGSWPAAIDAFLAETRAHGWRPAVLGAGPRARELWAERGLRAISIGDEVVVDVGGFSLVGRSLRNVRQAVRRTGNAGISTVVVRECELDPGLAAQLRSIHRHWIGARERGFAMNLDAMGEGRHPEAVYAVAVADDGYAVAFQRYLPAGQTGPAPALSLDVMPRHPLAPNGVNERLIVDVIAYAKEHGFALVSLNFAAFRPILEAAGNPGAAAWLRGTRWLIHLLDPLIEVESLYRFNAKFRPGWLPRAVMVRSWLDLPAFGAAALGLEFALPYDRRRSRPESRGVRPVSGDLPLGAGIFGNQTGDGAVRATTGGEDIAFIAAAEGSRAVGRP
jgi:lysyl-tRNA synthetase, class II